MVPEPKCQVCGASPTKSDKFYRQMLCSTHWAQRRQDAMATQHVEWLLSNDLKADADAVEKGNFDASHVDVESHEGGDIPGR